MPKPVKKPVRKLKTPPKPKRPSDPNRAAHSMIAEHLSRVEDEPAPVPPPLDFEAQYKAHMAKLGKKGGDISGERRMNLPLEVRRRVASIAARAMWAKRKGAKKR
jgi:hypothetical protein